MLSWCRHQWSHNPIMYHSLYCGLMSTSVSTKEGAEAEPAHRCWGLRNDMFTIILFAYLTVLPPFCAGQPVRAPFWCLDAKFHRPACMEPRFTGHDSCVGDVKQRSRDAECCTAGTAGHSSPWTAGTCAQSTWKQGHMKDWPSGWGTRET